MGEAEGADFAEPVLASGREKWKMAMPGEKSCRRGAGAANEIVACALHPAGEEAPEEGIRCRAIGSGFSGIASCQGLKREVLKKP